MRISSFIARRYLFAKTNPNAINVISGISLMGYTVGAMALVMVLSVFNGFEALVHSLYNSYDPALKVSIVKGKTFYPDSLPLKRIMAIEGVTNIAFALEENVALRYDERQTIATLKGVSANFNAVSGIDSMIYEGQFLLKRNQTFYTVAGIGVAARLGMSPYNDFTPLVIYVPRRGNNITYDPERALNQKVVYPSGVFSIDDEINNKYLLTDLQLAQDLLERPGKVSALEIALSPQASIESVQKRIQNLLGEDFTVKNRQQQQELLYKVFRSEKWATSLILLLITLLLTFTVVSALTMLVMEKRKDIAILQSMGASNQLIRWIFIKEGLLIALFGGGIGLAIGFVLCYIQQTYGIIGFGAMETFVVSAYPVLIKPFDFVFTFLFVLSLGLLTSLYPAYKASGSNPGFRNATV